ncbi:hypothetical protein ABBQ32_005942 [Trebouxia sp. C0010 RCD-2024]
MEENSYWEATRHALQAIVKKPKLTEALLRKPPFRFLHDVISEVQRNTGFAPGLFTGSETDAKAIQDKEGKVAYLQKMIDLVSVTLSEPVVAKPAKEASISRRLSADQAAATASQPPTLQSTNSVDAEAAPARPVPRSSRSMAQAADSTGSAPNITATSIQSQHGPRQDSLLRQPSSKEVTQQEAAPSQLPRGTSVKQGTSQGPEVDRQQQPPEPAALPTAAAASRPQRPTSARRRPQTPSGSMARPGTSSGRPGSAVRPPAVSPPAMPVPGITAQPQLDIAAAPDASSGRQVISSGRGRQPPLLPGARPASAGLKRPASAAGPSPAVALIEEGEEQEDEADILVVTETMPAAGSLVGQGAEGQGALEQIGQDGSPANQQGTGIILRRKKRDDSSPSKVGDTLVIADMVQRLCQSTNPLARCVEHLQEDLETMTTEFNFWAEERRRFQDKLVKHQESNADTASSQSQLADLDGQLDAAAQRILSLKRTVLQDDMTIHKLLHMSVGLA